MPEVERDTEIEDQPSNELRDHGDDGHQCDGKCGNLSETAMLKHEVLIMRKKYDQLRLHRAVSRAVVRDTLNKYDTSSKYSVVNRLHKSEFSRLNNNPELLIRSIISEEARNHLPDPDAHKETNKFIDKIKPGNYGPRIVDPIEKLKRSFTFDTLPYPVNVVVKNVPKKKTSDVGLVFGDVKVKNFWVGDPESIDSIRRNCRNSDERTFQKLLTFHLNKMAKQKVPEDEKITVEEVAEDDYTAVTNNYLNNQSYASRQIHLPRTTKSGFMQPYPIMPGYSVNKIVPSQFRVKIHEHHQPVTPEKSPFEDVVSKTKTNKKIKSHTVPKRKVCSSIPRMTSYVGNESKYEYFQFKVDRKETGVAQRRPCFCLSPLGTPNSVTNRASSGCSNINCERRSMTHHRRQSTTIGSSAADRRRPVMTSQNSSGSLNAERTRGKSAPVTTKRVKFDSN